MPFAEHSHVTIETSHTMRIDAAKVRGSENVGGLNGIFFGNAEVKKDARAEFAQGIDRENFSLDGGHGWPFFEQIACVNGLAPMQCLGRICVFNSSCAQDLRLGVC